MLRKLVIFSFQNIHGLNGSAKFIKQFEDNKVFLKKNQVDLDIYSNSAAFKEEIVYRRSIIFAVKRLIKKLLLFTVPGTALLIKLSILNHAKRTVDQYAASRSDTDCSRTVFLFNDFFTMSYFFERFPLEQNTVFMMHNNGETLKMLFERYPKFRRSPEAIKMIRSEQRLLNKVKRIIFVSHVAEKEFLKKHPSLKDKTRTIYIGHRDEKIVSECDGKHLEMLTVGTVSKRKNQIGVIKALAKIKDSSIHYTVIGGGDGFNECQKFIREKKLEAQVTLAGSKENVKQYMKNCNLYVSNSYDEGLPIAAQEALECGLPILTTDVGGCSELIEENGLLIQPGMKNLIKAIEELNRRKDELKILGMRSRKVFLQKFCLDQMLKEYVDLIDEICG